MCVRIGGGRCTTTWKRSIGLVLLHGRGQTAASMLDPFVAHVLDQMPGEEVQQQQQQQQQDQQQGALLGFDALAGNAMPSGFAAQAYEGMYIADSPSPYGAEAGADASAGAGDVVPLGMAGYAHAPPPSEQEAAYAYGDAYYGMVGQGETQQVSM